VARVQRNLHIHSSSMPPVLATEYLFTCRVGLWQLNGYGLARMQGGVTVMRVYRLTCRVLTSQKVYFHAILALAVRRTPCLKYELVLLADVLSFESCTHVLSTNPTSNKDVKISPNCLSNARCRLCNWLEHMSRCQATCCTQPHRFARSLVDVVCSPS
jgi:hypothetical protein